MQTTPKTYYDVLGVARNATPQDIKKAYRRLAAENHPDRHPDDPTFEARFKEVSEAYEVLRDTRKRRRYDRQFEPIESVLGFFQLNVDAQSVLDLLREHAPVESQRGADVLMVVEVSSAILERGGMVSLTIPGKQESFLLRAPQGETLARLPHLGADGAKGGEPGDLWIKLISK